MNLINKILIMLRATKIGEDDFGNRYYEVNRSKKKLRNKRYVIYNGIVEASKIPADWNGWLHHTFKEPPLNDKSRKHEWELEHLPNLTGTKYAYRPTGHFLKKNKRKSSSGDYKSWDPN